MCLVSTDMLCPVVAGGVWTGSLQVKQKAPEGQSQKLIHCVWGTKEKAPCERNEGGNASWTLMAALSSREITDSNYDTAV